MVWGFLCLSPRYVSSFNKIRSGGLFTKLNTDKLVYLEKPRVLDTLIYSRKIAKL